MKRVILRILLVIVLVGLGGGAGYGYGKYLLGIERRDHEEKVADFNRKIAAIQKKYTEERDQKASCESQRRTALAEIEKMRQAGGQLVEVAKQLEARVAELDGRNKETAEALSQARSAYTALEDKAAEIAAVARDRGEEIKKLNTEKQGLESRIKGTEAQLDHCESNNARLAILGTELVEKYENKGMITTILKNEPFTQVKKVEIENMAAEYREQIEKEKLKKQQKSNSTPNAPR
jgi:chromosome segregation ATPase